jgi:hypothetical protein
LTDAHDFIGTEHLTRSDAGNGASCGAAVRPAALVTKMAFARQGWRVSHLSGAEHGLAEQRRPRAEPDLTSVERPRTPAPPPGRPARSIC